MKAIHCETKEQFKRVLEDFEEKGWVWGNGDEPTENIYYWDEGIDPYYAETCLEYKDMFGISDKGWFEGEGYKIIKAKDYLGGKMYKKGDVLVDRHDDTRKVLGVCGDVYLMSWSFDHNSYYNGFTKQDLEKEGWKLAEESLKAKDLVEIDGKAYSESTIKEALREYTK